MNHPIAATAQASSESETSKAARPPEKAPLFYWNGVRDAEGEKLQPVYYHIRHVANPPVGTITVASSTGANFSAKVCRYFDVEPLYSLPEEERPDRRGRFSVVPSHPLYPQVKAAADTYTVPARFTKINDANGNHIITRDNRTGLEWSARVIGEYTNMFDDSDAERACRELTLGDHTDWRLPTVDELLTLVDRKRHPAIHTRTLLDYKSPDSFFRPTPDGFWTSDPSSIWKERDAWIVDSFIGACTPEKRENSFSVRAVRDPDAAAKAGA